jgi:hypothetical protein
MIWNLIKICIVVGLFQGCWFYSMKGSLPAHIHSISLASVTNESAEFAAAVILNEELNELMMSENVLDIVLPEQADSRLNVVIISVTDQPYTVTLSDVGLEYPMEEVEEWKLTIKTTITWYDMNRDEILFEKKMSSWGSYTPGVDIGTDGLDNDGDNLYDGDDSDESGSPRESALGISVRRLTEDIVNEITNTW